MSGTSPASYSLGCASHHVAASVSPRHSLERWSSIHPQTLRLHLRGCGNGGTRVDVDFPAPHVMYLRRGWKTFARIHSLTVGLVLYFKLMEDGLLSVKVYEDLETRLKCCVESSSDDEDSSSSESDEEDSDSDDKGSRREDDGSD